MIHQLRGAELADDSTVCDLIQTLKVKLHLKKKKAILSLMLRLVYLQSNEPMRKALFLMQQHILVQILNKTSTLSQCSSNIGKALIVKHIVI